nr:DUF2089 family protein [Macrococcus bovicus]
MRRNHMDRNDIPEWMLALSIEDLEFMKKFVLASGSLKSIAKIYDVSYPTVRVRLNSLIQKIEVADKEENSEFISYVKSLAIDEVITLDEAKKLIKLYKAERGE